MLRLIAYSVTALVVITFIYGIFKCIGMLSMQCIENFFEWASDDEKTMKRWHEDG